MPTDIEITNLSKTYKNGVSALKNVSLSIPGGSFFALLGPNGAGKSTLINILASLVVKTTGQMRVAGHDAETEENHIKRLLGVMPQEVNLGIFERVEDILINQAGYYGIPRHIAVKRMDHLLSQMDLMDKKTSIVRNLSGGMKRRVMVARALIHDPQIIILDEPTAGVDIEIRRNMWDVFKKLNQEGKTIILTTHYLEEAEQLCDHVAIIHKGELIKHCDMPTLLQQLEHEYFILYLDKELDHDIAIDACDIGRIDGKTLEVRSTKDYPIGKIISALTQQGVAINSIRNKTNRLENLFLELTSS